MKQYYKTREEWETMRNALVAEGRIGGSMVGTAAGVDPWKSPYTLWAELSGRIEKADLSGREAIKVGTDLEDYVARRFCELTGKSVHRENCIITNEAYPHLFATIDRKVSGESSGLECKTANAYRDGAFAEGSFPDGYYRQVKTYLAVTGLDRWYLAVLVMGIAFRVFLITRRAEDLESLPTWVSGARLVSEMEIDDCEDDAARFVACVQSGNPPSLVGTTDERASLNAVNGLGGDTVVTLTADADMLVARRRELKAAGDAGKEEIQRIENQLIELLGGSAEGRSDAWKVTYKVSNTLRLNKDAVAVRLGGSIPDDCYKATSAPTLRISPIKKNYK